VTVVGAGGVPASWLMAPLADPGRVLLFVERTFGWLSRYRLPADEQG
jgi:hypothetical protein